METTETPTIAEEVTEAPVEEVSPETTPVETGDADLTLKNPLEQDGELTLDDFYNAKNGLQPEVKKEDKVEEKVEETPEEVTTEEVVPEPKVEQKPASRVDQLKALGITSQNALKVFSHLPNSEFANLINTFKENKTLKEDQTKYKSELEKTKSQTTQPSLYTHPQGYLLNPQYSRLSNATSQAQQVVRHWTEQLAKIRKGEQWKDLNSNDKGQIFVDNKVQEPTTDAEVAIEQQLQEAKDYYFDYSKQLKDLEKNHGETFKKDVAYIKAKEDEFFPGYDKEDHKTFKLQKDIISALPASMQDNPLAPMLAKTVANNALFANMLKAANAEIAQLKAKTVIKPKTPPKLLPTSSGRPVGSGKSDPKNIQDDEITLEDFHRARQGVS